MTVVTSLLLFCRANIAVAYVLFVLVLFVSTCQSNRPQRVPHSGERRGASGPTNGYWPTSGIFKVCRPDPEDDICVNAENRKRKQLRGSALHVERRLRPLLSKRLSKSRIFSQAVSQLALLERKHASSVGRIYLLKAGR